MNPETEKWLQEVRARLEKATPGPWISSANRQPWPDSAGDIDAVKCSDGCNTSLLRRNWKETCANIDFLTQARTDIPRLLALITEQAEFIAKLTDTTEALEWLKKVYTMGTSPESAVPQRNAGEMMARLDSLGFGKQEGRRGNTLMAMVMDCADELESLRSEANRAGFDALAEVLSDEETGDLEANEIMFNRGVKHAVEVVERKRDEWQVEFSKASNDPFQSFIAAANEILADLRGEE